MLHYGYQCSPYTLMIHRANLVGQRYFRGHIITLGKNLYTCDILTPNPFYVTPIQIDIFTGSKYISDAYSLPHEAIPMGSGGKSRCPF